MRLMLAALACTICVAMAGSAQERSTVSFTKEIVDWARVSVPVNGAPSSRYVSFEVAAPTGTVIMTIAKESDGEEWRLAYTVVLLDTWQRVVVPLWEIARSSPRLLPTGETTTTIPVKDLPTKFFSKLVEAPKGNGTLDPKEVGYVYIDFAQTNGMEPLGERLYQVRNVQLIEKSLADEAIDWCGAVSVNVDAGVSLGEVEPLWADAWMTPPRYGELPQRVVRLPVFGENRAISKDGIDGTWDWSLLDEWVSKARERGSVVMQIVGRDVPEWLWSPAKDNRRRTLTGEWFCGNFRPPTDFAAYEEIHYRIARHLNVDKRFGVEYFEFWTEPDGTNYYLGDFASYCKMYEAMARGIKRADPEARVGCPGVATYRLVWIEGLLDYCARRNVPLDFISIHEYTLDAELYEQELKHLRFMLSRYPQFRDIPMVVSEWNTPFCDGAISETLKTGYPSAAFAASAIYHMIEGGAKFAPTWNPEMPSKGAPVASWAHQGFTLDDGTPRPKFNAMKCYAMMRGERVAATTNAPSVGVEVFSRRDGDRLWVLVWWHLSEPKEEGIRRPLTLEVSGLGEVTSAQYKKYLIDKTHSNCSAGPEHKELEQAAESAVAVRDGTMVLDDTLELFAVALYEFHLAK